VDDKFLAPRLDAAPILNQRYFEPDLQSRCFSLGELDDANDRLLRAVASLAEDRELSPGWKIWWNTCTNVIGSLVDTSSDGALEAALAQKAQDVLPAGWTSPEGWGLIAAIYPVSSGGTNQIADVYRSLIQAVAGFPEETALFARLCKSPNSTALANLPADVQGRLVGHIDDYE